MKRNKNFRKIRFIKHKLLSRLKSSIASSKWLSVVKSYINQRKWTVAIFLISILLSLTILWQIYNIYSPAQPATKLNLTILGSKAEISKVIVRVFYDARGKDNLILDIYINPTTNNLESEAIFIDYSSNIRPLHEKGSHNGFTHYKCPRELETCYHFDKTDNFRGYILSEDFSGNIFGHGSQEDFLDFHLAIAKNGAVVRNTPVEINLMQLSYVNVGTIFPEPIEKSRYLQPRFANNATRGDE